MFILCILWKILVIGPIATAAVHTYYAREFENTTLIWYEIRTNITNDVESRTWRKDDILMAWLNERGFDEPNSYKGRLIYNGNDSITIRNATQNDSGTYTHMVKVKGVKDPLKFYINLQVIGSLANVCTPVITLDGSNLRADLPQEAVCINLALRLEWNDTGNKSVTYQNGTAILHLGRDSGGVYRVCAVGEATKYFQGNMSDFCTSYTISGDQGNSILQVVLPCVLVVIALVIFITEIIFWRKYKREFFWWIFAKCKGWICQKSSKNKEDKKQGISFLDLAKTKEDQVDQEISSLVSDSSEKLPAQDTTNRDTNLSDLGYESRNKT